MAHQGQYELQDCPPFDPSIPYQVALDHDGYRDQEPASDYLAQPQDPPVTPMPLHTDGGYSFDGAGPDFQGASENADHVAPAFDGRLDGHHELYSNGPSDYCEPVSNDMNDNAVYGSPSAMDLDDSDTSLEVRQGSNKSSLRQSSDDDIEHRDSGPGAKADNSQRQGDTSRPRGTWNNVQIGEPHRMGRRGNGDKRQLRKDPRDGHNYSIERFGKAETLTTGERVDPEVFRNIASRFPQSEGATPFGYPPFLVDSHLVGDYGFATASAPAPDPSYGQTQPNALDEGVDHCYANRSSKSSKKESSRSGKHKHKK